MISSRAYNGSPRTSSSGLTQIRAEIQADASQADVDRGLENIARSS